MNIRAIAAACCMIPAWGTAQDLAPFITPLDHFMAFERGRFREVESRKPQQFVVAGDRIVYVDDQGRLKFYAEKNVTTTEREGPFTLIGSRGQVVFTSGSRLGIARATGSLMLSNDAADVSVSDSLVAWYDRASGKLNVCWRNDVFPAARIAGDAGLPQWQIGPNTMTFFDRSVRTAFLFYRGRITELCDSSDFGRVSCGGDVVAYWDGGQRRFMVMDHGERTVLEEFEPVDFQAGDGVVVYNDALVTFNVYRNGASQRLLDHMPTKYWVKDSTVVFVDRGMFWTEENGKPEVVEEFVPEQWEVHNGSIVYLSLNREIMEYRHGRREMLSRDASIARFDRFGNAVIYRNQLGTLKVLWKGRVYEF